ncbi:MAG: hypothetical protein ACE5OP_07795 [Candidatus Glassbacteria bacterium]
MNEKEETSPHRGEHKGPHLSLNVDLEDASIHPDRIAASVAIAFYRELRRHNFNNNQIIKVASELIDCLNKSLEGYKRKMEKDQER